MELHAKAQIKNGCRQIQKDWEPMSYYMGFASIAAFPHTDAVVYYNVEVQDTINAWLDSGLPFHKYARLHNIEYATIHKYEFTDYYAYNHGLAVGLVMPTRMEKERLKLIEYAGIQQGLQTLQPDIIKVCDWENNSPTKDITFRYRRGCEMIAGKVDLILAWEDDDWYDTNYINKMVDAFVRAGKPELIGIDSSLYYNVLTQQFLDMKHHGRSSMNTTGINASTIRKGKLNWCADDYSYTDAHLWKHQQGVAVSFDRFICVGIKHGFGLCGGGGHQGSSWRKWNGQDKDYRLLGNIVDSKSLNFYKSLA